MPYNVSVIGTGYVGIVTGTCFAETGNNVICVDIDPAKIEMLRKGKVPIYEPGLDLLLERNIRERRISFTLELEEGVLNSDVIFLCLPTPPGEDGSADLQYVLQVAEEIGKILHANPEVGYKVIVDKSTVPAGTSEKVEARIRSVAPSAEFDIVSNPEFLREGRAVEDSMRPDRIVVGTSSEKAKKVMVELYEPFVRSGNPIHIVSERSAEVAKYAANSYIAMRISYINEMANFCDAVGANIDEVRSIMGSDSRIGKRYLYPGVGYGGSCFPKDVRAILKTAEEHGAELRILSSVVEVNREQPLFFTRKILKHFGGSVEGKRFAVWGLAFKANTDDVRESPAFGVIDPLLEAGASIVAYDPEGMEGTRRRYEDRIEYGNGMYETLKGADALLILTEWSEFRSPDFGKLKESLNKPVIFDGRNLLYGPDLLPLGFEYYSVGRPDDAE
ncbi:MAG: UDP-glucose/GDP-mannose dehydrogenase family protein [Candidatus Kapaibacterium sp.]